MNQRKHLTLVAAGASLLASLPLESVFDQWTWLVDAFLITLALGGVALLLRSLRAPAWAPTLGMLAAGVLVLTWIFPPEGGSIIPTVKTFTNFNSLLLQAGTDMSQYAAPVPDRQGFLFLATLGVGSVVIVIDLFAVVLRRPALAGLPMLAIYSVPVAVKDESVSMIPFVLGAAGFLWLLVTDNVDRVRRFGRRFTGDGRDVDLWEPSPLAAAGQRLGLIGLVIAVAIPLLLPGMTGGGLLSQWAGTGGAGVTGGKGRGTSVGLFAQLSGELNRDKAVDLLKVTNLDDSKPGYLRFGVADQLNNGGFTPRDSGGSISAKNIPQPEFSDVYSATTYKAQIEVAALEETFLPDYTYTTKVDKLSGTWQYDTTTAMISSDRDSTKGKKYTIEYRKLEPTKAQLEQVDDPQPGSPIERQFATVPPNQTVHDTVAKLIAGKSTEYDKVLAILDFFSTSNNFIYDTNTGQQTSGPAIESFLKNKKGFCVQYAAAMAWLVREARYPSRVAFGFTRGGKQQGNTLTLTNFQLHAWTEVYFAGYGWLTFDATPATSVQGSVSPAYAPNPSGPVNLGNNQQDKNPALLNPSAGVGGSAGPDGPNQTGNHGQAGTAAAKSFWTKVLEVLPWLVGGIVVLLLLLSAALARLVIRRRRERYSTSLVARATAVGVRPPDSGPGVPRPGVPPGPRGPAPAPGLAGSGLDLGTVRELEPGQLMVAERDDWLTEAVRIDAHHAWEELVDAMIDYRVPVDLAETPRRMVDRVTTTERLKPGPQGALRRVGTAEEFARYAPAPMLDVTLQRSLVEVRRSFAARANRGIRIRAVLLPPSVTGRWRLRTWNQFTDVSNWLGRRWYTMINGLSVRRRIKK